MKSKRGMTGWLSCIAAIIVVGSWAVLTLTPVQEGPGALTVRFQKVVHVRRS